ncbi:MAG: DUF2249 domain-containing protein [Halobacteriaceae archaeon]
MPDTHLDLRDMPRAKHNHQIGDAVRTLAVRNTVSIVVDRDIDPALVRYQLDHDRTLDWEYTHPDDEPRELQVTKGESLATEDRAPIDVRDLAPQRRHAVLLEIVDQLDPGEGLVLVNDHDPKPLYHELVSLHGDVIDWTYRHRGPDRWELEVVKTDQSPTPDTDGVVTRFDIREIPADERHPTIHHRYGMLPEDSVLELIADHEPEALHEEFDERYESFDWEVTEADPDRVTVRITKGAAPDDSLGVSLEIVDELDVRDLPPAQRHEIIFETYSDLGDGTGFVLVNDHDPKPLYHQFVNETGPEFRWEYQAQTPGEFRVLIGKTAMDTTEITQTEQDSPF